MALAEVFDTIYVTARRTRSNPYGRETTVFKVDRDSIYDFLFERDYAAWFCNRVEKLYGRRAVKEFVMRLHTGETQYDATPNWSWEQRQLLGQRYLHDLAEDILNAYSKEPDRYRYRKVDDKIKTLLSSLELDGYAYHNPQLLAPESDVLDVQEEAGILDSLYGSLALDNKDTAFHHLALADQHYLNAKWDDSISNSRKFLECVLREVTAAHSLRSKKTALEEPVYTRPVRVREYLEKEGLLEAKEKEAIASIYRLLSETGGHPYMARNDQARLLRQLALNFSQFVMLRFQGSLNQAS